MSSESLGSYDDWNSSLADELFTTEYKDTWVLMLVNTDLIRKVAISMTAQHETSRRAATEAFGKAVADEIWTLGKGNYRSGLQRLYRDC